MKNNLLNVDAQEVINGTTKELSNQISQLIVDKVMLQQQLKNALNEINKLNQQLNASKTAQPKNLKTADKK